MAGSSFRERDKEASPRREITVAANPHEVEAIVRLLNREVWIVTAADGTRRGGLAATWVSQASIDREAPVMLAGIASNHFTAALIDASGCYAAHLITAGQIELAWNFALGSGRTRDKLANVEFTTAETGSPILSDCLAWLDCRVAARLDGGDRIYYWADVLAAAKLGDGKPLTEQQLIAAATQEQRRRMIADREGDVQFQRLLHRRWRENLPDWLQPL